MADQTYSMLTDARHERKSHRPEMEKWKTYLGFTLEYNDQKTSYDEVESPLRY